MPDISELLFGALDQRKQENLALNPLYGAGVGILKSDFVPVTDWKDSLLQGLARGFSGGLMTNLGREQVEGPYFQAQDELRNALLQDDPSAALGRTQNTYLKPLASKYQLYNELELADLARETAKDQIRYNSLYGGDTKPFSIKPEGRGLRVDYGSPNPLLDSVEERKRKLGLEDFDVDFSKRETLEEKYNKLTQTLQGPLQSRGTAAREIIKNKYLGQIEKIQDESSKVRDTADKLEGIASKTYNLIQSGADTGPVLGQLQATTDSILAAFGDKEAEKRVGPREDLKEAGIQVALALKSAGPQSDFEFKTLLSAAPKISDPTARLQFYADRLSALAQQSKDYSGFLDWWGEKYGDFSGAKRVWSEYREKFPLFVASTEGVTINKNIPNWQQFLINYDEYRDLPRVKSGALGAAINSGGTSSGLTSNEGQSQAPEVPPGYRFLGRNPQTGKFLIEKIK